MMCTLKLAAGSVMLASIFSVNICLGAATTANASAEVIALTSPTETAEVIMQTATEAIISTAVGVLTLNIPGGGGMTMTATGAVTNGGVSVFTTSDSAALSDIIQALIASGGSLTFGGVASSGQALYITILKAVSAEGGGIVYATVAYN